MAVGQPRSGAPPASTGHSPLSALARTRRGGVRGVAASLLLLLGLLLLAPAPAAGMYQANGPVELLTEANFDSRVNGSPDIWVVEFFAPWCGHCKALAPDYSRLGASLHGIIRVAAVDCDAHPALAQRFAIKGFPTIKLFPAEREANPYTHIVAKVPIDYKGPRTAKKIAAAATALLPGDAVARVAAEDGSWEAFVAAAAPAAAADEQADRAADKPVAEGAKVKPPARVVLFSAKPEVSSLFKALALRFKGRGLSFAQAAAPAEAADADAEAPPATPPSGLAAAFGVTAAPALYVEVPNADDPSGAPVRHAYSGSMRPEPLEQFLEPFAGPVPADLAAAAGGAAPGAAKAAKSKPPLRLPEVAAAEFEEVVMGSEEVYVVGLEGDEGEGDAATAEEAGKAAAGAEAEAKGGAKGGCAARRAAFVAAAVATQGQVPHIVTVNISFAAAAEDPKAAELRKTYLAGAAGAARECLQILVFPFGSSKADADPEVFPSEEELSGKSLLAFAMAAVPDFVDRITQPMLDSYLSNEPAKAKVILFSDKPETPALYRALAANFRTQMHFALAGGSDESLLKRFSVKKLPTLSALFVKAGTQPGPEGIQFEMSQYQGALKYPYMANFIAELARYTGHAKQPDGSGARGASRPRGGPAAPPAAISELASPADFAKHCTGLCVLGLFTSSSEQLPVLKAAAAAAAKAGQAFSFGWIDAPKQRSYVAGLGLNPSTDVPTIIVLSVRKQRVARLKGRFGQEAAAELLADVLSGRASTEFVQDLPVLVEGGEPEPAAGADGSDAPVEEEFDLSDVMGESVGSAEGGDVLLSKEERLRRAAEELAAEHAAKAKAKAEAEAAAAKEAADAAAAKRKKAAAAKRKKAAKAKKAADAAAAAAGGEL